MEDRTFTDQDRSRLGELRSRVDLSAEEREEMDLLNRRFLEQALGGIWGDFICIEDSGGGQLIPYSEAAKEAIEAVEECQRGGIRVTMITGDHKITAAAIA